ncbi:MAG: hypothetical protein FWH57_11185 [Oscillospiraceae bacterium]|nr:hypothetical protein [Oscillospiraceae bacterium]
MELKTGVDYELRTLLREELETLQKYVEMFDDMSQEEKAELREWMAQGKSVNSNPNYLYAENGCLLDFINASRMDRDMVENPEDYR